MLLSAVFLACTCTPTDPESGDPVLAPPVPTPVDLPFALTEAPISGFPDLRRPTGQHLQLHHLPARIELADADPPDKVASVTDEFLLSPEEVPNPRGAARHLKVLRAPLPFPVSSDQQTFRPEGMKVTIDGVDVPFTRLPAPQARKSTWRITGRHLVLSHPEIPAEGSVKVIYAGVRDKLDRHLMRTSGMVPADFVRTSITLGSHTRSGLLLVDGTELEWDVTLPEGRAVFSGWLAMDPAPVARPKSDGAAAVLYIVGENGKQEVGRQAVPGITRDYAEWRVDLSEWAGQDVTLRMETDALENPIFDWLFVGSPSIWGSPKGEVRRVVVIGLDTTRPDHISFFGHDRDTTPEIDAFAESGLVFDHAWSTAPRTRPAFRSATTGRLPLQAVGAKNIGATFSENGFATAGIVANVHLQPKFDFSDGFDSWAFDGKASATEQVDRALSWLEANVERDSYLFLHFMDPHMIYDAPGEFRDRFVTDPDPTMPKRVKRSDVMGWMNDGDISPQRQAHLEALHDGEMAYTSHELGRLIDALDRMPGRTVVVMHSDHGEEFWEHEGFEHNHTLYDELTRALLIVRPRGGLSEGRRIETPASLVDIGPTLYDLVGFEDAPKSDGRTLVPLMAGIDEWPDRPLAIAHLQYSHERWGVVWNKHKYILHTGTGREELYDLAVDPGEDKDLSTDRDLTPYRTQLSVAHVGLPVGPGWRVRFELAEDPEPFVLTLPEAARAAGILDPEAVVEHRANIEWGEIPKRLPEDIGVVTESADKKTLTFEPGTHPNGIVYVLFDTPQDAGAAQIHLGGDPLDLDQGKRGPTWKSGNRSITLDPGTIVVPPSTEADRMGIGPGAAGIDAETKMLCALGYITEGCPEDDQGDDEG